jgi:hypothetical protein
MPSSRALVEGDDVRRLPNCAKRTDRIEISSIRPAFTVHGDNNNRRATLSCRVGLTGWIFDAETYALLGVMLMLMARPWPVVVGLPRDETFTSEGPFPQQCPDRFCFKFMG